MIFDIAIYEYSEAADGPDLLLATHFGVDVRNDWGEATAVKNNKRVAQITTSDDGPITIDEETIQINGIVSPDTEHEYGKWILRQPVR